MPSTKQITKQMKQIWTDVKRNHAALDSCEGPHQFEDVTPEKTFDKTFICKVCGGRLRSDRVRWYKLGLEHGGRQ